MASIRKTDAAISYIKSLFANNQISEVSQRCINCKRYGTQIIPCNDCRVFCVRTGFKDIEEADAL